MHSPTPSTGPAASPAPLPPQLRRADELDRSRAGLPSGHARLDAELPGGGWALGGLNEVLLPQAGALEWRLLAPALARRARPLLLIGPPHEPHLPGLAAAGPLIWIAPDTPQQLLWATEQAIRSGDGGAVLAWLPRDAGPPQLRRLQAHALASHVPIFVFRAPAAAAQASAAPLRVQLRAQGPWQIGLCVLKRRGPALEGWLALDATPPALAPLLTPRMRAAQFPARSGQRVPGVPTAAPVQPALLDDHALARPAAHAGP
ncbi:MAG: translesion DNA synthesis-associated protein ImuA [Pelomonas sp.]|nr:translesion DNA synthesis-associated protein ImuA [Roseateles sp.]